MTATAAIPLIALILVVLFGALGCGLAAWDRRRWDAQNKRRRANADREFVQRWRE